MVHTRFKYALKIYIFYKIDLSIHQLYDILFTQYANFICVCLSVSISTSISVVSSIPFDVLILIPYGMLNSTVFRLPRLIRIAKYDTYFKVWEQYSTRYP